MLQFIAILFFAFAIFILASIRKRQVMRNCVKLSLLLLVATVILWLRGQLNIEDGVDFHGIGKSYCEIDCFGGKAEFSVTRYEVLPQIIQNSRNNGSGGTPKVCNYCNYYVGRFFYSIVVVDPNPQKHPRVFEKFGWEFEDWNDFGLSPDISPTPKRCYTSIEIPYWFIALVFSVLPLWRLAARRFSTK